MSTVKDRGIIDITLVEDGNYVLVIVDDMEWTFPTRQQHGMALQNKINDYLNYISSGQAAKAKPGLRPVIRIVAQYAYSRYCLDFLERVKAFIKSKDDICDIEWTHSPDEGPFEDGFSDDYVFDPDKIYPRLKKNWAKDPLKEVSIMVLNAGGPNSSDQMVMIRVMNRYIGMFVQDVGSVYTYISYDMLPEGLSVEDLQRRAFDNLVRDIRYRSCESKEKGIYGILAGGNFEAESLCLNDIWRSAAEDLGDDIVITVPTKDIVYFTKFGDKKLRKKMLNMAKEMFLTNQKQSPYLIFSKDIFTYSRAEGKLLYSGEW